MHQLPMKVLRAACLCLLAGAVHAASYPSRPVRVIVPVPAGGGHDLIARIVMTKLGEVIGTPFVIDNRTGAGQIIGAEIVAKAQPDGYTLLFAASGFTIAPLIYPNVPFDVRRDFAPIMRVGSQPLLLAASAATPATTVQELIALARAKPDELKLALASPGSSGAVAGELFRLVTQTQLVRVPYKGGAQALAALMSNEVQLTFLPAPSVIPFGKAGKLRILGTSSKARASYLPDVPTFNESGIRDFDVGAWQGVVAPARTPDNVIGMLHTRLIEVLKLPATRERLAGVGTEIVASTPKEFAGFIERDLEQNRRIVKAAGLKAD